MTISVGDKLPEAALKRVTEDGAQDIGTGEYFAGRTIVLFGVPGAFTPTCSNNHLPGFLENRDAILTKGVDAIAVIATNDHHVMRAWARFSGGEGQIDFLADGNGTFTRALGLVVDMSAGGLGMRTRRFSMIVKDGVVQSLNLEEKAGTAEMTGAARVLELL
jgi:glutaredoxin/glutathione-dependent peroxiredoxin